MRFQELLDADNQRNNTHIDFEKQLNLFRSKYKGAYDFALDYADNEHLLIQVENPVEYTKEVHKDLTATFNVKLVAVTQLTQQLAKREYITIEYCYKDIGAVEPELSWENIKI